MAVGFLLHGLIHPTRSAEVYERQPSLRGCRYVALTVPSCSVVRAQRRAQRIKTQTDSNACTSPQDRIKNSAFAFTGAIYVGRENAAYTPTIRRLGGQIIANADRIRSAIVSFTGEIFGGRKETKKLRGARREDVPIITEEEFFAILAKERGRR